MRLDLTLVRRGMFASRAKARAAIEAGLVTVDGVPADKPAAMVSASAALSAEPAHPYVSRGGVKLAAALDRFGFDPRGKVCLDIGASTGGFTDVLLRAGARRVYAVDVGTGQLHPSLRGRADVIVLEQTDARAVDRSMVPEAPALIAIDVSFISLKKILPAVTTLASAKAALIALIKPQFEAGRKLVRKGIVRDPRVHLAVCEELIAAAADLGWDVVGVMESPIAGGDGNREFLLGARLAARTEHPTAARASRSTV
jgi:23S rRNA (cytidine1920-2'-O)/16S rRNA (cytidine1409-2'-O)-methyltransferase